MDLNSVAMKYDVLSVVEFDASVPNISLAGLLVFLLESRGDVLLVRNVPRFSWSFIEP